MNNHLQTSSIVLSWRDRINERWQEILTMLLSLAEVYADPPLSCGQLKFFNKKLQYL